MKDRGVEIIRSALPRMEPMEQRCVIKYMITVKEGVSAPRRYTETHEVMYFFKPQIEQLLLESGFRLTKLCILSDIEKEANENDWSIVAVARVI